MYLNHCSRHIDEVWISASSASVTFSDLHFHLVLLSPVLMLYGVNQIGNPILTPSPYSLASAFVLLFTLLSILSLMTCLSVNRLLDNTLLGSVLRSVNLDSRGIQQRDLFDIVDCHKSKKTSISMNF
ncbi:hypothetical protein Tco_0503883 [Tanacetum coccineum]